MNPASKTGTHRTDRGSVLVVILIFTIVLGLGMASLLRWNLAELRLNHRHLLRTQAHYAVESVLEHGFSELNKRFIEHLSIPVNSLGPGNHPLRLPSADFFYGSNIPYEDLRLYGGVIPPAEWTFIDPRDPANTFDPLAGRMVLARTIVLLGEATARRGEMETTVYGIQRLQVRDAPLFSNAIFYNLDLEIAPGPAMEIHGSVHGNRALYFQSNTALSFHDRLTNAGQLFHGRKPGSGQTTSHGNVSALSSGGPMISFQDSGGWLQSTHPDWRSLSAERWQGNVQTVEHGVQPHNPVAIGDYVPNDPNQPGSQLENPAIQLIHPPAKSQAGPAYNPEVEQQKYSVKAGLRIVANPAGGMGPSQGGLRAYTAGGVEVELPPGVVTTSPGHDMRDARRGRNIHVADVDVGLLKQVIENPNPNNPSEHIAGYNPDTDWNGIVYFESTNLANTGVRLVNASQVPNYGNDPGFTFATNNALYVQGNFNADGNPSTGSARESDHPNEPPAALIGDAVTILSENWDDSKSYGSLSWRNKPSYTEISAAILTGIVPSGNGRYSGGVENLPRLLEDWTGVTLTIRGSMVVLYESEVATEPWSYGGNIYTAPVRDWGFHMLFSQGIYPPGTPNTRTFRRSYFRDISQERFELELAKLTDDS